MRKPIRAKTDRMAPRFGPKAHNRRGAPGRTAEPRNLAPARAAGLARPLRPAEEPLPGRRRQDQRRPHPAADASAPLRRQAQSPGAHPTQIALGGKVQHNLAREAARPPGRYAARPGVWALWRPRGWEAARQITRIACPPGGGPAGRPEVWTFAGPGVPAAARSES